MKFEIKSRWTLQTQFECELEASLDTARHSLRLGAAIEAAYSSGADLRNADLRWADLRWANLRGCDLRGCHLYEADLHEADLRNADLREADLRWANLRGCDLRGCELCGCHLDEADLRWANLRNADLRNADLRNADLRNADLRGAKNLKYFPISLFGHKHFIQTTTDGQLQVGCQVHSFDEWETIAEELGKRQDYSALDIEIYKLHIAHIAKVARLLWASRNEVGGLC